MGLMAQDFFADWDMNKDGKITMQEFPGDMGYFNQIDFNKDRVITRREFEAFMRGEAPGPEPVPQPQNNQEVERLQKQIQQLTAEKQSLNQDNANLRRQIQQLQATISQLQAEVNRLKSSSGGTVTPVQPNPPQEENSIPGISKPAVSPAQGMIQAEECARLAALEALAVRIRGSWVAACSENIDGQNKILVVGQLNPTHLVGVKTLESRYDFMQGMVTVPVEISRANIIESIRRTNQGMSHEEFLEIQMMFPPTLISEGRGAWNALAQKQICGFYAHNWTLVVNW
jgi:hypothetical protein